MQHAQTDTSTLVNDGKYPLGFKDEAQFRNLTRPIAQKHRDATIIVSGSSVTGRSGDGSRAFRDASYPYPTYGKPKELSRSDIDLGIVKPGVVGKGDIDHRGFPKRYSKAGDQEFALRQSVSKATGHPTGTKFFDQMPTAKGKERPHIVRPHTPESER